MSHSEDRHEVAFLGLRFASLDEAAAHAWIIRRMRSEAFAYVVTPNVDHVVRLHGVSGDNQSLRLAYDDAELTLCDSRILALLAAWSGLTLPVVAGSDLTLRLLTQPLPEGTRLAIVGGNHRQMGWLAKARPEAQLFHHAPPMGLRSDLLAQEACAAFIEEIQPHLILFTVGSPQSELVARLVKERGRARGVAMCVGASLEFLTGEKRRAPPILRAMRMEWAFRLLCEPRRLWRRYLVEGPAIVRIWWQARGGR